MALEGVTDSSQWYSARNRETLIRLSVSCDRGEVFVLKESMDDAGVCVLAVPPISLGKLDVVRFRLAEVPAHSPTDQMSVLLANDLHEVGLAWRAD